MNSLLGSPFPSERYFLVVVPFSTDLSTRWLWEKVEFMFENMDIGIYDIAKAIIEKDIETLLGYALPESKKIVGELFEDSDSNFYKAFFGEKDSYREFMINAQELDCYIYEYPYKDSGFSVFYYDKKLIKSLDELSLDAIRSMAINGMVLEHFIFYLCDEDNKCRWYMNYQGHGYSGPDDEA